MENVFKENPFPTVVAVITTKYGTTVNAAPVTWFTPCSYDPPLIMVALKSDSDTLANMLPKKEFVIQTMPSDCSDVVHILAKKLPRNKSELELTDGKLRPALNSVKVKVPRLANALQWYECRLWAVSTLVESHTYVYGQVLHYGENMSDHSNVLMYCGGLTYGQFDVNKTWEVKPY